MKVKTVWRPNLNTELCKRGNLSVSLIRPPISSPLSTALTHPGHFLKKIYRLHFLDLLLCLGLRLDLSPTDFLNVSMLALCPLFHVTFLTPPHFLLLCLLLLFQNLSHHPASLGVFANSQT